MGTPKKKAAKRAVESDDEAEEAPKNKKSKKDAEPAKEEGDEKEAVKSEGTQDDKSNDLTVFIRGLPFATTEEVLRKDFTECGEIEKLNMPLNEEGRPKGIAFIKYKSQEGFDAAIKFDNTEYGGRTINCSKAGEGKGKGKDGKGKNKGADNE